MAGADRPCVADGTTGLDLRPGPVAFFPAARLLRYACAMLVPLRSRSSFLGIVSVLACACDPMVPPVPTDIGPRDTGVRDTFDPIDVPTIDAPLADGEVPDVGDGGMSGCDLGAADILEIASDLRMADRVVGLAAGDSDWAITWHQSVKGFDEIFVAGVGVTGDPTVTQVTSLGRIERDPAVVATDTGWLLAWSGNHMDLNYEVYAQSVGTDLMPIGSPSRLSEFAGGGDGTPTLTALPTSGYLVAWVQGGMTSNLAVTRVVGATGAPTAAARTITTATNEVTRPTLGFRSAGAVLAWGESSSVPPAARVLALDAAGAASGSPVAASTEGNADGTSDITMDLFGGAMVFGATVIVRPEVRIRLLDGTGTPSGSERAATTSAGRDASIASFGGGYLVSYRSADAEPVIRLALLDAGGVFIDEYDLADAAAGGGRTTVRVTTEGRVLVTWADAGVAGTRIRAARVRCE